TVGAGLVPARTRQGRRGGPRARPNMERTGFSRAPGESHMMRTIGRRRCWLTLVAMVVALGTTGPRAQQAASDRDTREWIQLFEGGDLTGWTRKFAKHDLGGNLSDAVRAEDGLLKIRYDKWTKFDGEFGHIFYGTPFSHYIIAAEYRFVGEQVPGG